MASRTETATAQVLIDSTEAAWELENLKKKSKELKVEMDKAFKAGDKEGWMKAKKQFDEIEGSMKKVKNTGIDITRVMKNLNGTNLKDLLQAEKQINNELKGMTRGTAEYVAKSKQLQLVTAEVRKAKTEMTGLNAQSSGGFFGKLAGGFNKYFGVITAAIASFTGVAFSVKKAVDAFNEFEQSVANLSALTGLTGDDLKFLSDRAKELSVGMTESGVRITNSATDIVEGFKLMGSARPELLENKDALAQVTESALVLSAAAGIDMQSAVLAVAASMNQFNLKAEDSNTIINALAAGSLKGSAEVGDLTEAFSTVGTVAHYSNLTMEETVGVLETLAEKQLKGVEAGTQLKTSLIAMKAAGLGYQSGIFNMRDALVELKARMDAAAPGFERDSKLIEVFGKRNITVGTILTNSIDRFDYFAEAVKGSNTAIEQANVNTDTNAAKLAQAKNRAHEVAIELGEKLSPVMTALTGYGTKLLKVISAMIEGFIKYKGIIIPIVAAIAAYTAISYASIIADKIKVLWTDKIIKSLKALYVTMRANPWAALGAAIVGAISYLMLYDKGLSSLEETQKSINKAYGEAAAKTGEQKTTIEALVSIIQSENVSLENKKRALKALNDISPEYLGNLTLEQVKTGNAKAAIDSYLVSLDKKMKQEALLDLMKSKRSRLEDIMVTRGDEQELSLWETFQSKVFGVFKGAEAQKEIEDFYKLSKNLKEFNDLSTSLDKLGEEYKKLISDNPDLVIPLVADPNAGKGENNTENEAEKQKKAADDKLKKIQEITRKYNQQFFEDKLSENEKENELIKQKYDKELESVGINEQNIAVIKAKGWANINETEKAMWAAYDANREAMHAEIEAKEKEHQDKLEQAKLAAQEEIWQATLDGEEAEMVSAMQKYDKLFQLAYENGVDTTQLRELMDKEMALIHQKYLDQEVAKTQEAEKKKQDLRKTYLGAYIDIQNTLSGFVSSMKEDELADAEGNEKKQKAIKKKYADVEMAINISKILSETALAIMGAYTAYASIPGGRIISAVMAGVLGGVGIAQVGLAIKERNRIKSMAVGGPTGDGFGVPDETGFKVAGKVHQDEYVIPAWLRKNPQVAAYENIIEAMRVNRTGYAAGGAASSTNTVTPPQIVTMTDPQLLAVMMEVSKKLDNPTRAKVVYSDFENMGAKVADAKSNFES